MNPLDPNYPRCRAVRCDNAGRYDSGYCGICDLTYNAGRGEKRATTKTSQTNTATADRSQQPQSAGGTAPTNGARDLGRNSESFDAQHAQPEQDRQRGAVDPGHHDRVGSVLRDLGGSDVADVWLTQSGGLKFDDNKLPYHLIPAGVEVAIARVLAFGGAKYAVENWRQGFEWHRLYNGIRRHLTQFWVGEELDPESGEPHLAHLLCMAAFLYEHAQQGLGIDDRHKLDRYALDGFNVSDVVERGKAASQ